MIIPRMHSIAYANDLKFLLYTTYELKKADKRHMKKNEC